MSLQQYYGVKCFLCPSYQTWTTSSYQVVKVKQREMAAGAAQKKIDSVNKCIYKRRTYSAIFYWRRYKRWNIFRLWDLSKVTETRAVKTLRLLHTIEANKPVLNSGRFWGSNSHIWVHLDTPVTCMYPVCVYYNYTLIGQFRPLSVVGDARFRQKNIWVSLRT